MRPRPSLSRLKGLRLRGLVRISAMLSLDETFSMEIFPLGHFHEGNGVRFLYVWCESVGRDFLLRSMEPLLSQRTETYSTSVVEMARAVCFLENHDVRQHPMNVKIPLVLLRLT
ncbi:hypothetical protein Tco_1297991 [Tanacetum coccineum]